MLTNAEIRRLAEPVLSNTSFESCCRIKKGLVNENYTFKADGNELILRLYHGEKWKARKERYLYNLISKKTDAPVPKVYMIDDSGKVIKDSYAIMSKVPGIELRDYYLKTGDKSLAAKSGELLAKLHSIEFPKFGWIVGSSIKPKFTNWRDFVFYDLSIKIKKLATSKKCPKDMLDSAVEFVTNRADLLDISEKPSLVHKDYHFSHILATPKKIEGLIDFEWAIAGHKELDFVKARWWMFEEFPELEKPFMKGYKKIGSLSSGFEKRKNLYDAIVLVSMVSFSYEIGSSKWFNYNLKRLREIIE